MMLTAHTHTHTHTHNALTIYTSLGNTTTNLHLLVNVDDLLHL